ncbi:MAG: phosphatase PAP2 family protein [Actinobacteria bacterium]|nr:phosphatase PAP2 family protein [Actinomycetota bacterium]
MSKVVATTHRRRHAHGFPGWRTLAAQVFLVTGGALAYFLVRGLTMSNDDLAVRNARRILDLESRLGIDWEVPLQRAIDGSDALITLMNWIYIYGHWPVLVATLVWLFIRWPSRYYTLRNALFISGAIGLVIFALFPVAPPRLGVLDVADTVTERSRSYRTLQPPELINLYAAVPSLHFGWNLLVGIFVWRNAATLTMRVFGLAVPPAMAVAVVATGNHFVLDVLAGGIVALSGLAVAHAVPALRDTPPWAR